jgi:hypothetical protein
MSLDQKYLFACSGNSIDIVVVFLSFLFNNNVLLAQDNKLYKLDAVSGGTSALASTSASFVCTSVLMSLDGNHVIVLR